MKNLITFCLSFSILLMGGLACKNNPLAKFTNQYNCTIPGEPEPVTADDFVKRGAKHLELNNYSADFDLCAFGAASEAVRLDPNNADALALRGHQYFARSKNQSSKSNSDDLDNALTDLNEAIRLVPNMYTFYGIRSSIYEDKKDLDKAIADLTKSISLVDSHREFAKRGDLYEKKGDYENAVKDYTDAIRVTPDSEKYTSVKYLEKRADVYYLQKKYDLVEADKLKISELNDAEKKPIIDSGNSEIPNSNKKPIPKTISGGMINGKASNLVKPVYPAAARAVRASGAVNVQVTVDEEGNVISASAVSGHPLLCPSAVQAARESKFNPTLLSGTPVKVTGVIVYNFTPE